MPQEGPNSRMARKGRRTSKRGTRSPAEGKERQARAEAKAILESTQAGPIMVSLTEKEAYTLILTCDAGLESIEEYVMENDGTPEANAAASDYGTLASARNLIKIAYVNSLKKSNA